MNARLCQFAYDYPYLHGDLRPGCQFPAASYPGDPMDDGEDRLVECDGKLYCPFHLPMVDKAGTQKKSGWTGMQLEAFRLAVGKVMEDAKAANQSANLTGVVFPGEAVFREQELPTILAFGTTFAGTASFEGATFTGTASFEGATFTGAASFWGATFTGAASFESAVFVGDARFGRATFKGAWFEGATFMSAARFGGATFTGAARFGGATFMGAAWFEGAAFTGTAWFEGAAFTSTAWFEGANFMAVADFSWSERWLERPGQDKQSNDQEEPRSPRSGALQQFDFSDGFVRGIANFSNRSFTESTNFNSRVFEQPPKFHNATLHRETKWRGTCFMNVSSEDAADDYRTLRQAMEETRNRPQEGVFFALEQRAMRHGERWWKLKVLFSFAYDWTADYGRSVGRPIGWLIAVTLLFGLVYLAQAGTWPIDGRFLEDLVGFTIRQVTRPFQVWGREWEELIRPFTGTLPFTVKLLATLQSVISLALIALFILALRWQFRRG